MAKKPVEPAEFTVPPESITKGGSYTVDPASGKVERVAFMEHPAPDLSPKPAAPESGDAAAAPVTTLE